nr:protein ULTRAPETALA 1 [Ipomoea batatas]
MAAMFSDEEVGDISGVKIGDDYVEVTCGCTSHRYGDAVGRLRVFSTGELEITCECTPGCQEDKMTPAAFEKHSGRETARKWKNNIWVIANDLAMEKPAIVMNLSDVLSATKSAGSVFVQGRNAEVSMTLWLMLIGNALICLVTKLHVMTMRSEQAGGCTVDAPALQRAEAAPPACVLDARSADSQIAVARLVSISLGMSKLEGRGQTVPPFP